jgi:phosphate transport system substrate-binding protein
MNIKGLVVAVCTMLFFVAGSAHAGNLTINGSTTVLPIAQKVAEAYMKVDPKVKISVSGGGSGNGIKALIDGTTDIADSSRFIKDEEVKAAVEKGAYPVPFAVAYDSIIPIVHSSNSVKNLTVAQLKAIYMGEVKNWKEVGGPNKELVIVSRDTSSGTYEVWEEKIMKGARVSPGALLQASNGAIVQAISKNRYAIGYIGLGYVNKSVKPLTVNGIQGSAKTTLDGTYPISRALYMFTRGWPKGDALNFINYVLNPLKGQRYVKEAGFVPLYTIQAR